MQTVDKEPRPALPAAPTVRSSQTGFPKQTQASSSSTTPKRPFPPAAAGLGQPKSRVNSQRLVGTRARLRGGRGHVGGLWWAGLREGRYPARPQSLSWQRRASGWTGELCSRVVERRLSCKREDTAGQVSVRLLWGPAALHILPTLQEFACSRHGLLPSDPQLTEQCKPRFSTFSSVMSWFELFSMLHLCIVLQASQQGYLPLVSGCYRFVIGYSLKVRYWSTCDQPVQSL